MHLEQICHSEDIITQTLMSTVEVYYSDTTIYAK